MSEVVTRNWDNVSDNLKVGGFWKPKAGQFLIKFLNEGGEEKTEFSEQFGKEMTKVIFDVEIDNIQQKWSITQSEGMSSLWGQVSIFAKYNKGLTGKTINLLVTPKNGKNNYTIVESTNLIQKEIELRKIKKV